MSIHLNGSSRCFNYSRKEVVATIFCIGLIIFTGIQTAQAGDDTHSEDIDFDTYTYQLSDKGCPKSGRLWDSYDRRAYRICIKGHTLDESLRRAEAKYSKDYVCWVVVSGTSSAVPA